MTVFSLLLVICGIIVYVVATNADKHSEHYIEPEKFFKWPYEGPPKDDGEEDKS